jgi:hypothetical protein
MLDPYYLHVEMSSTKNLLSQVSLLKTALKNFSALAILMLLRVEVHNV